MSANWSLPVLTYHAANVAGGDYAGNDHVALAADLAMFADEGWRVVPLVWAVEQFLGLADRDLARCVALTCDDGTDLDVRDVDWPGQGPQRGFHGILADAAAAHPELAPHLTSFVIADPAARARMDVACLHGRGWMSEWWAGAATAWDIEVGCHSWDHNHEALDPAAIAGMARGDFLQVDDEARADFQVAQALDYINPRIAPRQCRLFAYPYGHAGDFLRSDYLPRRGEGLGLLAAFGVQGEHLHPGGDRWHLPRYVCGWHWRSPDALRQLLVG